MNGAVSLSELPQEVRDTARLWNFDAYLAATLAPAHRQFDLIALAAYAGELERIPQSITEPTLAQIRVQWWRDELQRLTHGQPSDHPIGAALKLAAHRNAWPFGLLVGVADAVADELSGATLADPQMLNAWLGKRYGALFDLATRFDGASLSDAVIEPAGRAYGLAMLNWRVRSDDALRGELALDQTADDLAKESRAAFARALPHIRTIPRSARAGLLPLSLVRLYVGRSDAAPSAMPGRLSKVTRIAAAHWLTRF